MLTIAHFITAPLIISTVISALFLFAFFATHSLEGQQRVAGWTGVGLFFACLMSPVNLLLGILLLVAANCLPRTVKRSTRSRVGIAITLGVYVIAAIPGARGLLYRLQVRDQYPVESLAGRLDYEQAVIGDSSSVYASANSAASITSEAVNSRLQLSAARPWDSHRTYELKRLHQRELDGFVFAVGFGIGRMPFYPQVYEPALKYQDEPEAFRSSEEKSYLVIDGQTVRSTAPAMEQNTSATNAPKQEWLLGLHDEGAARFVNPESLGYVTGRQQAAGFVSHRFTIGQLPQLKADSSPAWTIARLELVSLLKHKNPRVYISAELPQMDKLKNVPTRELTEFEWQALSELWHREDIVIAEEPDEILMLGALRAHGRCLECHSVKQGQLLGAFSYSLRPVSKPITDSVAVSITGTPDL